MRLGNEIRHAGADIPCQGWPFAGSRLRIPGPPKLGKMLVSGVQGPSRAKENPHRLDSKLLWRGAEPEQQLRDLEWLQENCSPAFHSLLEMPQSSCLLERMRTGGLGSDRRHRYRTRHGWLDRPDESDRLFARVRVSVETPSGHQPIHSVPKSVQRLYRLAGHIQSQDAFP